MICDHTPTGACAPPIGKVLRMTVNSQSLGAQAALCNLPGYSDLAAHRREGPKLIDRAAGVRIWDTDGRDYIDASSSMWCASLGHGQEALVEAAATQMRRLSYYFTGLNRSSPPVAELSAALAGRVPLPEARIHFATTGSEANDFLMKFAIYANNARGQTQRKMFLARHWAYHGATMASASLTGLPRNHQLFDLPLPNVRHIAVPHYYRMHEAGETEDQFTDRMAEDLEATITDIGSERIAGLYAEPVMGAAGVVMPPRGYFQRIREVLDRHGAALFADEVITGFGRTGNLFACETFGIRADAITMAKGMSGAHLPIAAIAVGAPMYEALEAGGAEIGFFAHGSTYAGHPVAAAVALEVLAIMEREDVIGHVRRVAPKLEARLRALESHPLVGEVRGVGLMWAVELIADKRTRRRFDPEGSVSHHLQVEAETDGVILRIGSLGDVACFAPPLIITEDEIDDMVDRFERALARTLDWAHRQNLLA